MFFSLFSTHFKWSKPGLKQNCEASLSPINQDFLESCQYVAMIAEKAIYRKKYAPSQAAGVSYPACIPGREHIIFMQKLFYIFSPGTTGTAPSGTGQ